MVVFLLSLTMALLLGFPPSLKAKASFGVETKKWLELVEKMYPGLGELYDDEGRLIMEKVVEKEDELFPGKIS